MVLAQADEGAVACTDPSVHLPEKFTVLRLLFFGFFFSQNWASAALIPAWWWLFWSLL